MIRWILLAAALYMLYTMLQSEKRKKAEALKKEQESRVQSGELIKDPVCGAYVDKDNALSVREGENLHHFCSYECRDAFLADKQKKLPENDNNDKA